MSKNEMIQEILSRMQSIESKLDEVRTKSIPSLHTAMEVQKIQIQERMGRRATIIAAVGGIIGVLVSIGASVAATLVRHG